MLPLSLTCTHSRPSPFLRVHPNAKGSSPPTQLTPLRVSPFLLFSNLSPLYSGFRPFFAKMENGSVMVEHPLRPPAVWSPYLRPPPPPRHLPFLLAFKIMGVGVSFHAPREPPCRFSRGLAPESRSRTILDGPSPPAKARHPWLFPLLCPLFFFQGTVNEGNRPAHRPFNASFLFLVCFPLNGGLVGFPFPLTPHFALGFAPAAGAGTETFLSCFPAPGMPWAAGMRDSTQLRFSSPFGRVWCLTFCLKMGSYFFLMRGRSVFSPQAQPRSGAGDWLTMAAFFPLPRPLFDGPTWPGPRPLMQSRLFLAGNPAGAWLLRPGPTTPFDSLAALLVPALRIAFFSLILAVLPSQIRDFPGHVLMYLPVTIQGL